MPSKATAKNPSQADVHTMLRIMNAVLQSCHDIGVEETLVVLENNQKSKRRNIENPIVTFVKQCVSMNVGITLHELDNQRAARTDERKHAIGLCVHILKDSFDFTVTDIRRYFGGISRSTIWRSENLILSLNPKLKTDAEWLRKKTGYNVRGKRVQAIY